LLHPSRVLNYVIKHKIKHSGITFYRPLSLGTYGTNFQFPIFAYLDRFLIKYQINSLVNNLSEKYENTILVINKVQQHFLTNIIPDRILLYEVTDEYKVLPEEMSIQANCHKLSKLAKIDDQISISANLIFTSSRKLAESRGRLNPETYFIKNTADYAHFSKSRHSDIDLPADIEHIKKPIAGFIGQINELLDLDLLNIIAADFPKLSLVLIGKINGRKKFVRNEKLRILMNRSNVYHLGFKKYEQLPNYLKAFDFCLLPYLKCEWMKNSFPNKIFQYLASGKPVISTDFPAVREVGDVISIAINSSEFATKLKHSIENNSDQIVNRRILTAKDNTSDKRAAQKIEIIESYLRKSRL